MKGWLLTPVALVALFVTAAGTHAADVQTLTGTAAATRTDKRPLLVVDGKRYELKASDKAEKSVAETLEKFSKGDTGTYTVKGVLGPVNGNDGILVESITPDKADPGTGTPAAAKRPGYKVYDHAVKATPPAEGEHQFRLVVPEKLEVVRGILVVGPYAGGDSRDYHEQAWYREFLDRHGFAFLGAKGYYLHDYTVMQAALKQFAADSKHPELVDAPYAATGFSAGGGYTRKLMHADPGKVIAGVVVGSTMKLGGELTDDHRRVPMLVINGEKEHDPGEGPGMAKQLEPVLAEQRPKGALWGWMAVQGVGHECAGQEVLSMPMLDAAVRLRYPADADVRKGPVKLKPVDLDSGWIADNTSWKDGLTAITPAKTFKGEVAKSSWLLNEDIAFVYRAYSTLDRPLKITSPDPMSAKGEALDTGSAVAIKVDDTGFAGWTKLELYDGATKAGELTKGKAEFTVKDLSAGYHAFSVLGTDGKGNTRPSNPVLVVVRKPAEKATTAKDPGLTVLTTFPGDTGDKGPNWKEKPDTCGAVGPDHVVDFTIANVVIHDKKTGKVLKRMTQPEFWKATKPAFDFDKMNDPRLLYDPLSGRWFGVHCDVKSAVGYLAVSESSDPTKGWKAVKLPMERTNPGMKLGVDKNGLYVVYYDASQPPQSIMTTLAIPIADAVAAEGPSLEHLQTLAKLEMECFPATDLDPKKPADAPAILLNHDYAEDSFSKMYMHKITWKGTTASVSKMQTIPLAETYSAPHPMSNKNLATQPDPGENLQAGEGRRTQCVVQHGGSLFTCNGVKRTPDSRCGIYWNEIRAKDGAVLQEGVVDDPDYDYLMPSLAVDANGNVGLGCTRTSAKEYPSVCVMLHAADDPPNTMRPAVLAAKGTTAFKSTRPTKYGVPWGSYSTTCLDPSDPTVFWTYQEYATSSTAGEWATCWVAFKRK